MERVHEYFNYESTTLDYIDDHLEGFTNFATFTVILAWMITAGSLGIWVTSLVTNIVGVQLLVGVMLTVVLLLIVSLLPKKAAHEEPHAMMFIIFVPGLLFLAMLLLTWLLIEAAYRKPYEFAVLLVGLTTVVMGIMILLGLGH